MRRWVLPVLGLFVAPAIHAAEGMWTLDNLPRAALKQRYGFEPDAAWVDKVMKSSVRLAGGCSGSFVSKDGLVLTNHHCVVDCVAQLSSKDKDYVQDGFLAKTRADEKACPEIELNRLERISDVTERVNKATEGKTGRKFSEAQKAEKSTIEAECVGADKATTRCDVVELYHGGLYHLYRYHRFQDVRLVFAPEVSVAFFGGDPDNFNFPRYNLDMGLLRAYENGKPAAVKDYFPVNAKGAQEGELTMITGHPGSTQRQLTVAQLERLRDVDLIPRLLLASELRGMLTQFSALGAEQARIARTDLFSIENGLKARKGQLQALLDPAVFSFKRRQEDELRAAVAADPAKQAKYGKAWDEIAAAQAVYRDVETRYKMIEIGRGFYSRHFEIARHLVRGAEERAKPNEKRLREYSEAALPSLTQELFSSAPIYPEYEKVTLAWSLTKLREWLGADDPFVRVVLGKESPEAVARQLVEGTQLADVELRKKLWEGGAAAVARSKDPFIELARAIDGDARDLRRRYENEVEAVEKKNAGLIAAALFEQKGTSVYPDATFTLRLSYGEVKGWTEKGQPVAPFTDFAGAFRRHTGYDPFALPQSWLARERKLNPQQRFNFVTTNDIIGGNSGSPIVNRKAEVVGLVFDGNIQSLGGAFWFDERVNRAVGVHAGAVVEALRKVYDAGALADELTAR
ncbi:MAG: S46 family peptidase [Gammaproteobacteria bacterium]|nr:S46 family peptidase [Gammaproteobacteria bacterium]